MKLGQVATPVTLMVLTAGVAAYVYLVDRGTVSDEDRAARRRDVLPAFRVEEVTRIELTQPGDALVLERDADAGSAGAGWTMTSPRRTPADPGAVDALLRELETSERVRDVDDSVDAGVASPRVRGTVSMGALALRFALGADAPRPEGAAYMRVEGEGTFVVGRSLRAQLLRRSDDYRPRNLVPYGESEVGRLRLAGPDGSGWTLERHGAGFRLGDGTRASRATVDRIFTALAEARAETFLADDVADRAIGPGAMEITVSPREARPGVDLRLGGECPDQASDIVAVRTAPSHASACVARSLAEALAVEPAALVDTSPFFAHADEIEELRLEDVTGASRVDLARRGSGWRERAPEDRDLSQDESESASLLASALADARAGDVVSPGVASADRSFVARSRATVIRTGGSVTEVVELAAPGADGTTRARRIDDGAVLRLPPAVAVRLQPHPVALRGRGVWRAPVDPGSVVALESTCGAGEKLASRAGAWSLQVPAGFAPDPLAVSELTSALLHAKAEAWIAESDDGQFGLLDHDACKLTMTWTGAADAEVHRTTITFGAPAGDGFYAKTTDDPAIFVAPAMLRALATRPVVERRRFSLDPSTLTTLVVVRDGARHPEPLDTEGGAAVADAVAGLVVRAALHTGHATDAEGLDHPWLEIDALSLSRAHARADAGPPTETRLVFGSRTQIDGMDGYFARAAGLDATFVVLRPGVDAIVDALQNAP